MTLHLEDVFSQNQLRRHLGTDLSFLHQACHDGRDGPYDESLSGSGWHDDDLISHWQSDDVRVISQFTSQISCSERYGESQCGF